MPLCKRTRIMACSNCNILHSDKLCSHGVQTCLNCLHHRKEIDGLEFCNDESFKKRSRKFIAEREESMNKLLNMVKEGGDTWVPQ